MVLKKILLVDDDIDFIESQAEFLELYGFSPVLAKSGQEALELARHAEFELALVDMKMPGMNGIECMTELRKLNPGIRVVMISAFTQDDFIRMAFQSGALAVLSKPLNPETLLKTVSFLSDQSAILLVEDHRDTQNLIAGMLQQQGYFVDKEETVEQAKATLKQKRYDLLLLDFKLPDGTAEDLLSWMKNEAIQSNVVIITGYPEDALQKLPCFSAEDFIIKPFQPDRLLQIVQKHFEPSGPA